MKQAGTSSSVSTVEKIRPPITVTPIGARQLPSPDSDIAIGTMPATIATVVITIGWARLWPASIDRLVLGHAVVHHLDREIDQQDRVLGDDAEQHQDADEAPAARSACRQMCSAIAAPSGASSSEPMLTNGDRKRR